MKIPQILTLILNPLNDLINFRMRGYLSWHPEFRVIISLFEHLWK